MRKKLGEEGWEEMGGGEKEKGKQRNTKARSERALNYNAIFQVSFCITH